MPYTGKDNSERKNMMANSSKPAPENGVLDFHTAITYLEEKHGFDHRDYYQSQGHFDAWCNLKGYGRRDPDGVARISSQRWYSEYMADPKGQVLRPSRADFWAWLIRFPFSPLEQGKTYALMIDAWLEPSRQEEMKVQQALMDAQFESSWDTLRKSGGVISASMLERGDSKAAVVDSSFFHGEIVQHRCLRYNVQ